MIAASCSYFRPRQSAKPQVRSNRIQKRYLCGMRPKLGRDFALSSEPPLIAPHSDGKNDKDRVAPKTQCCGIGERQQILIDRFQDVRETGRELKTADP